jgi:ssDNA thymidine ADP-ribosyltransferase, DarT
MNEIERIVNERNIRWLVHFTRIENLEGILENGLLPRNNFEELGIEPLTNDTLRLDGFLEATSLSVDFPNYRMFWKCRCDANEQHSIPHESWIVLGLKPSILWEKDCAFCFTNAANSEITQINIEDRKGIEAFNMLFNEVEGKPTRKEMRIKNACPTDPQAEILVFDKIEAEFIIGAVFNGVTPIQEFREKFPHKKFNSFPNLFLPRADFSHWK